MALTTAWVGTDLFIFRQVHALVSATGRLSMGDLSARAPIPKEKELGHLAHAFNEMAEHLEERTLKEVHGHAGKKG